MKQLIALSVFVVCSVSAPVRHENLQGGISPDMLSFFKTVLEPKNMHSISSLYARHHLATDEWSMLNVLQDPCVGTYHFLYEVYQENQTKSVNVQPNWPQIVDYEGRTRTKNCSLSEEDLLNFLKENDLALYAMAYWNAVYSHIHSLSEESKQFIIAASAKFESLFESGDVKEFFRTVHETIKRFNFLSKPAKREIIEAFSSVRKPLQREMYKRLNMLIEKLISYMKQAHLASHQKN